MKRGASYQYTVFVEPCEEGGYFAVCPSLPGCHVQGESLEDTLKEMRAAIQAFLADLKAHGETVPMPRQVTVTSISVPV